MATVSLAMPTMDPGPFVQSLGETFSELPISLYKQKMSLEESLNELQISLYRNNMTSLPFSMNPGVSIEEITTYLSDKLNRVDADAIIECLTSSMSGLVMVHNVGDFFVTRTDGGMRHNVLIRDRKPLPYDTVPDDIFVEVAISDDLMEDVVNNHLAEAAKDAVEMKFKEFYTGKSKTTSKFVLRVDIFQVSDGSVGGTFLSGKPHLMREAALGLKWAIFETKTLQGVQKPRTRWSMFDPRYRKSQKPSTDTPKAHTGGMGIMTHAIGTDFIDFLGKGQECVTIKLAPAGAMDIVSQIGIHCAEI